MEDEGGPTPGGCSEPEASGAEDAESPRPLTFTVDFGDGKAVDTQRHRIMLEKFQQKHRRGQSLSKIEGAPADAGQPKKHPLTGNLPRKSSFQSEGYFSSDEKTERTRTAVRATAKRSDLTLPLKKTNTTATVTNSAAVATNPPPPLRKKSTTTPSPRPFEQTNTGASTPELELKDVSSPELDLVSPFSPKSASPTPLATQGSAFLTRQSSNPEYATNSNSSSNSNTNSQSNNQEFDDSQFVDGVEFDFNKFNEDSKSDTVSDAGTYTLETDNYTEEQKARMSIDAQFKIEQVSVRKKTEDYILGTGLYSYKEEEEQINHNLQKQQQQQHIDIKRSMDALQLNNQEDIGRNNTNANNLLHLHSKSQQSPTKSPVKAAFAQKQKQQMLSPILSPTQNVSIVAPAEREDCVQGVTTTTTSSTRTNSSSGSGKIHYEEVKYVVKNNESEEDLNKTFNKIMFPSTKGRVCNGLERAAAPPADQGSVISVTSSGAFRMRPQEKELPPKVRKLSLTKSETHVEAYVDNHAPKPQAPPPLPVATATLQQQKCKRLTANIVNVQSVFMAKAADPEEAMFVAIESGKLSSHNKKSNLPPTSPSKIPSPIHTMSRPRSRNGSCGSPPLVFGTTTTTSATHGTFSSVGGHQGELLLLSSEDSSLETESYLMPTQNCINALQQRLSLERDELLMAATAVEESSSAPMAHQLNNSARFLLKRPSAAPTHMRHNSLDDKCITKISNKLDHFNSKSLQQQHHQQNAAAMAAAAGIDQTFYVNQYHGDDRQQQQQQQHRAQIMHRIQNSPNNSPIRRSSSFSAKNLQANMPVKNTNVLQGMESQHLVRQQHSPSFAHRDTTTSMQRSASTANIRPANFLKRITTSDHHHHNQNQHQLQQNLQQQLPHRVHQKIDRAQYGDTESSSEEDFESSCLGGGGKKKDLSNLTSTRYNRAFSLRRARLDEPPPLLQPSAPPPKCPNTPEMRRKFQPEHGARAERAISVDRRPLKSIEVQSRYLQNVTRKGAGPQPPTANAAKPDPAPHKNVPKPPPAAAKNVTTSSATSSSSSASANKNQAFARTDSGRFSMRAGKPPSGGGAQKPPRKDGGRKSSGRSNSSLSSREKEFQNWKRRKSYDPMKAAAEGKRKEMEKQRGQCGGPGNNAMTQSCTGAMMVTNDDDDDTYQQQQDCDSSPSHSSSVHRSQSFHGTAAMEQLLSSDEEEDEEDEDLTLSADEEGFSPPTPSPCELSPFRASLKHAWKDHVLH